MKNEMFSLEINVANGGLSGLYLTDDKLNWVESARTYGTPYGNYTFMRVDYSENEAVSSLYQVGGITLIVERKLHAFGLVEKYKFVNTSDNVKTFAEGELGIRTSFNDNYDKAEVALKKKCHMHIWCGFNSTYIACKRFDGGSDNVGLLLNKGESVGYAIEREWNSNDRGDATLLLPEITLEPNAKYEFNTLIFKYSDFNDFYDKALLSGNFCDVKAEKYSFKIGEAVEMKIRTSAENDEIKVTADDKTFKVVKDADNYKCVLKFDTRGEKKICIEYGDKKTFADVLVFESQLEVIDRRLNFIVEKQQSKLGRFKGAFYLYDNERKIRFVENRAINDRSFGRERSGITCALLRRLLLGGLDAQTEKKFRQSVDLSMNFIDRALVSPTGGVYEIPTYRRLIFMDRLYNYSWYMLVYTLMFKLTKEKKYLEKAYKIVKMYYKKKGFKFYAINIPMYELYSVAYENEYFSMADDLKAMFLNHGDNVVQIGSMFPAHEVKYEQSIVAPSVDILLECYKISKDKKYLDEAESQLKLLMAFNGEQPSFHLNNVAIRHWDGYWFGKSKMYGDTFPHYWSCITAEVYAKYCEIKGEESFQKRADICMDNNLCLFSADGEGSCAYVYADVINGKKGKFYDEWSNDQDWALYFNLTFNSQVKAELEKINKKLAESAKK